MATKQKPRSLMKEHKATDLEAESSSLSGVSKLLFWKCCPKDIESYDCGYYIQLDAKKAIYVNVYGNMFLYDARCSEGMVRPDFVPSMEKVSPLLAFVLKKMLNLPEELPETFEEWTTTPRPAFFKTLEYDVPTVPPSFNG